VVDEQLNGAPVAAGASRAFDLRPLGVVVVVVLPVLVPLHLSQLLFAGLAWRALLRAPRPPAGLLWRLRIVRDVWLPQLAPTSVACGAILFATAMGAFGTAFTLASKVEVVPITIYNEFTNYANFALAASLSIALGLVTWAVLFVARHLGGDLRTA